MQQCSVDYTVTDGNGLTATNTITWTVPENSVVAVDDGPVTVSQNASVTIDVLANDLDPENEPFTITGIGDSTVAAVGDTVTVPEGVFEVVAGMALSFTANPDAVAGTHTYPYEITDASGNSDKANIIIEIEEVLTLGFFLDGDATETDNAVDINAAFAAGNPIAISDGNGGLDTLIESEEDYLAWAVATYGAGTTLDPVTRQVAAADGSTANVPVCLVEEVCGLGLEVSTGAPNHLVQSLDDTSITVESTYVTDKGDKVVNWGIRNFQVFGENSPPTVIGDITSLDNVNNLISFESLQTFNPGAYEIDAGWSGELFFNTTSLPDLSFNECDSQNIFELRPGGLTHSFPLPSGPYGTYVGGYAGSDFEITSNPLIPATVPQGSDFWTPVDSTGEITQIVQITDSQDGINFSGFFNVFRSDAISLRMGHILCRPGVIVKTLCGDFVSATDSDGVDHVEGSVTLGN